jgi:hypothetical protein
MCLLSMRIASSETTVSVSASYRECGTQIWYGDVVRAIPIYQPACASSVLFVTTAWYDNKENWQGEMLNHVADQSSTLHQAKWSL